jgi:lipopolysaccharide transport system permease protein
MTALRALWAFRGFILGSVQREFQSKYRNSLLGVAWTVINPLAMVTVYTVIFSQVMRARLPTVEGSFAYSIYLCAGLIPWGLFTEIVTRAQNVFLDNANLLKKLNFPRLCLPLIVVLSALINFGILLFVFLGFLLLVGQFPGRLWALLPALAVQTLLSIGLGVTLGVLNVFFRDVGQFSGIALSFGFWCTPIVYPASILPESIARLMAFNPMAVLSGMYQRLFLGGEANLSSLTPVLALALLFCALGLALFRRHAGDIADEL